MDSLAIVGDVHGSVAHLREAFLWLNSNWKDKVVFVGDYINRGPDSYGVMEMLVTAANRWEDRLVLLMGNHEASLIDFLETKDPASFLHHGGLQTVNNYLRALGVPIDAAPLDAFLETFPAGHRGLLAGMRTHYETDQLLISHAGFNPHEPNSRSVKNVVSGRHAALFGVDLHTPRRVVICGHYVQRTRASYVTENFICLDSGCGSLNDGPLSVLTLPNRQILTFTGEM